MSRVHFERQQTVYLKIPIDRLIAAMDRPSYMDDLISL
jgi:hypothetical protein